MNVWVPRLGTVPTLAEIVLEDREEGNLAGLETTAVFDGEVAVRTTLTLTGGDDDDTVRSAGAVESGSGRAFQDGQALDVLAGEGAHAADHDAVDDIQRLVVTVDGAVTTDDHVHGSARIGGRRRNLHTGHLTGKGGGDVGGMLAGQLFILHGRCGITEGLFGPCNAHGRHDDFIQRHRVFLHGDVHLVSRDGGLDGLHTEEVEGEGLSRSCADGEDTIGSRDNTQRRAIDNNGDAGHRFTFRIGDGTGNLLSLCVSCRNDSQKARQEQFYFFHKQKLWLNNICE